MFLATPVERGCGRRVVAGIYAECGLSPFGSPLEDFIVDPALEIPEGLEVSPIGITWFEKDGVTHGIDHVGSVHYPNVADFIEEVRRFGMSRRMSRSAPFDKLSASSRLLLVHSRAIIENATDIAPEGTRMTWWDDVEGGEPVEDERVRDFVRKMPSFEYHARRINPEMKREYRRGIFMTLPISAIAVVRDTEGGSHEQAREVASRAGIPVELVDE